MHDGRRDKQRDEIEAECKTLKETNQTAEDRAGKEQGMMQEKSQSQKSMEEGNAGRRKWRMRLGKSKTGRREKVRRNHGKRKTMSENLKKWN